MKEPMQSSGTRGIKALIVIKVMALMVVFMLVQKYWYLGDKISTAEEAAPKDVVVKQIDSKREDSASQENSEYEVTAKRKSFLDDLLTLPEINTETLKKDEVARYLSMIERKQTQVESRIQLLAKREEHLKKLEVVIDKKIEKLQAELEFFKSSQQKEKELNEERMVGLVDFYKKMPAKKAAPLFEKMDKDLVVALFKRIPQKLTTEILSLMEPQKSVELTEYFGRIRSGKEYEMLKEVNVALKEEFAKCRGLPEEDGLQSQTH